MATASAPALQAGQAVRQQLSVPIELANGSRVAVIGGGPAGSFFTYFLLDMARRVDVQLHVDVYESRDFSATGPAGCNMCGGVISESLVQALAMEGINLPPAVVQRGIDSYVLHMDAGSVRIGTPLDEKRIAVVHRGTGPRGVKQVKWRSFDGHLLELAAAKGAHLVRERVAGIKLQEGRPVVEVRARTPEPYDLLALAVGINSPTLKLLEGLGLPYQPPGATKAYIAELPLGDEAVEKHLGSSMHVFLLNIPRLEFAALIPKGDYATLCLLGEDIDQALVQSFLNAPEVKDRLPAGWSLAEGLCRCSPRMNVKEAKEPFADRIVFIGDCGVSRLYKDGIGAAYRTAKAAAVTAILHGVSAEVFRRHYWPVCRAIRNDNRVGKVIFAFTRQIQNFRCARRGVLSMASREQRGGLRPRMSGVLWDVFTGSAPYKDVFVRTLHPVYLWRLFWNTLAGMLPWGRTRKA